MQYHRLKGEDPAEITAVIRAFYEELKAETGYFPENTLSFHPEDTVIFDYFDSLGQQQAERIYRQCEKYKSVLADQRIKKNVIIRIYHLMFLHHELKPGEYLLKITDILINDRKLRRRIGASKTSEDEGDPITGIKKLAAAAGCNLSQPLSSILNQLKGKLAGADAETVLKESGYLDTDANIEKLTKDIIGVSVSYQVRDYFRDHPTDQITDDIDLMHLYIKYNVHSGNDLRTDPAARAAAERIDDERKISEARKFIGKLGKDTPGRLLIPVIIDKMTNDGIYIAGKDYFYKEAHKKHVQPPYAALNILSHDYSSGDDDEPEVFAYFSYASFEESRKNEKDMIGALKNEAEYSLFYMQKDNGIIPSSCPAIFAGYYQTDPQSQAESKEIAAQILENEEKYADPETTEEQ